MKRQCYLAIDLGAESGRVMAGLWDGDRLHLEEIHRFPNAPVEIAGTLRWDVLRLWSEIQHGLAMAAKRYGRAVKSVGVDTWGVDFVLLSKSGELLGQPFHYRDSRTRGMLRHAFARVPRKDIFAATGLQFMEINTLYQLLALREHSPEVLASAHSLLMMPDFFHWCLSGVRRAEFTAATTSQLFHPTRQTWSLDLIRRFDLPTHILPKVVFPGTRLGPMLESLSRQVGLQIAHVVAPASHDTGSAVAAIPATRAREGSWAYLSSGTWSLMGLELKTAQLSDLALQFNLTNEGGVDGTWRLLKNITGLWLLQGCKRGFERSGKTSYQRLLRLAAAAPKLRSLVDPDDQRFLNPPHMPVAIRDFCRETRQPVPQSQGELVRCVLESLVLKYQHVLGCLEKVNGRPVEIVHVVGGGSQNQLLNQLTADACRRPVVAGPVEATAMGNILVQARACGEIGSLSELRAIVRRSCDVRQFEPAKDRAGTWPAARERFEALLAR